MSNPVVLYSLMVNCVQNGEFENALYYAGELDEILGYNYYVDYVESEMVKARNLDRILKKEKNENT